MRKLSIGGAFTALLLMMALVLTLAPGGDTRNEEHRIGEPLDAATKAEFEQTGLGFIAETGRVIMY